MADIENGSGRVAQVNVSPQGGVPKLPVERARLGFNGVEGDKQRDRRYHGGPQRAVSLYSLDLIRELQDEGHPIEAGWTGENLTLEGLDWEQLAPGVQLQVGEARIEITDYTVPCSKIAPCFVDGKFKRILQKLRPGWSRLYAKVLEEGEVRPGDPVQVLAGREDRPA